MPRSLIVAAAALAIISAGSLISTAASAGGGAALTVTRNTGANAPALKHAHTRRTTQITEFSSSSAGYQPKGYRQR